MLQLDPESILAIINGLIESEVSCVDNFIKKFLNNSPVIVCSFVVVVVSNSLHYV